MKICSLHLRIYFGSRGVSFDEQVNAFSSKKGIIYAAMEIKNKTVKMQTLENSAMSYLAATCLLVLKSRK